jgi:hypothetical protein
MEKKKKITWGIEITKEKSKKKRTEKNINK